MQPRNQKKRLTLPTSARIVDELGMVMHFALLGMQHGDTSSTNWSSLAKVLLTISVATDGNGRVNHLDKTLVDASVLVLKQIADRELRSKEWQAEASEYPCLSRGILAAERALAVTDYQSLIKAYGNVVALMGNL
jgi:hypothetical protein